MSDNQDRITQIITGFDSAWTDKADQPGAIASIIFHEKGASQWIEPELATFAQAKTTILKLSEQSPFHLVAIDQPIVVPNWGGSRPVDKVAGSLISKLKGGAQPANRSREKMFGDDAPIWRLLSNIPHKQLPWQAHKEVQSNHSCLQFIVEVYPAMAIPGFIPYFFERGVGAKYNPADKKKFNIKDWSLICEFIEGFGKQHNIEGLSDWAANTKIISNPTKSDQDKLDGAICTLIGYCWYQEGTKRNIIIGDEKTGYILTPVTSDTRYILSESAKKRDVPVNRVWNEEDIEMDISLIKQTISSTPEIIQHQPKNQSSLSDSSDRQPINPSIKQYTCPIDGCTKVFLKTRGGWDSHVESMRTHPNWYPDVVEGKVRKQLFKETYPDWFK